MITTNDYFYVVLSSHSMLNVEPAYHLGERPRLDRPHHNSYGALKTLRIKIVVECKALEF